MENEYNVHPAAPEDVKEQVKREPCFVCGMKPIDNYCGPMLTNECPACLQQRPFYETWAKW